MFLALGKFRQSCHGADAKHTELAQVPTATAVQSRSTLLLYVGEARRGTGGKTGKFGAGSIILVSTYSTSAGGNKTAAQSSEGLHPEGRPGSSRS